MSDKKFVVVILLLLNCLLCTDQLAAQNYTRVFELKKGAEFRSEIITTSNSMIKRGKQIMNVSATNSMTKSYKVTEATDQGYKLAVQIDQMKGVVDADKIRTSFNSEEKIDTSSNILKGIFFMLKKPLSVTINKNGVINDAEEYKMEMASDTLVSFAGIQPELFTKSTLINFFADFTYKVYIEKNYSWTDKKTVGDQESSTRFLIDYIDKNVTILKFFKTVTSKMLNTNSNGTYVIDNKTGLIMEKYVYVISVGYQTSAGNVLYAVSRTTSIVEKTKKVK